MHALRTTVTMLKTMDVSTVDTVEYLNVMIHKCLTTQTELVNDYTNLYCKQVVYDLLIHIIFKLKAEFLIIIATNGKRVSSFEIKNFIDQYVDGTLVPSLTTAISTQEVRDLNRLDTSLAHLSQLGKRKYSLNPVNVMRQKLDKVLHTMDLIMTQIDDNRAQSDETMERNRTRAEETMERNRGELTTLVNRLHTQSAETMERNRGELTTLVGRLHARMVELAKRVPIPINVAHAKVTELSNTADDLIQQFNARVDQINASWQAIVDAEADLHNSVSDDACQAAVAAIQRLFEEFQQACTALHDDFYDAINNVAEEMFAYIESLPDIDFYEQGDHGTYNDIQAMRQDMNQAQQNLENEVQRLQALVDEKDQLIARSSQRCRDLIPIRQQRMDAARRQQLIETNYQQLNTDHNGFVLLSNQLTLEFNAFDQDHNRYDTAIGELLRIYNLFNLTPADQMLDVDASMGMNDYVGNYAIAGTRINSMNTDLGQITNTRTHLEAIYNRMVVANSNPPEPALDIRGHAQEADMVQNLANDKADLDAKILRITRMTESVTFATQDRPTWTERKGFVISKRWVVLLDKTYQAAQLCEETLQNNRLQLGQYVTQLRQAYQQFTQRLDALPDDVPALRALITDFDNLTRQRQDYYTIKSRLTNLIDTVQLNLRSFGPNQNDLGLNAAMQAEGGRLMGLIDDLWRVLEPAIEAVKTDYSGIYRSFAFVSFRIKRKCIEMNAVAEMSDVIEKAADFYNRSVYDYETRASDLGLARFRPDELNLLQAVAQPAAP